MDVEELIVRAARGDPVAKEQLRMLIRSGRIDVLAEEFWRRKPRGIKVYSIDERIRREELKKAFLRMVSGLAQ